MEQEYGVRDKAAAELFAGPGEMRALCRELDWASTPLGPVSEWPKSLHNIVTTVLASRHPMFIWWGPDLVQIYNDAYRPSFGGGGRHPRALGARGREFWTDIWDSIGPQIEGVMTRGEATWHEDQFVPIDRNGRVEDVWWTYGYSPVRDDSGGIGGVLVVCQETTQRMLAERRLKTLTATLSAERQQLAALLDIAPAVMAIYSGPDQVVTYVNPTWERFVRKSNVIGRPFREVFPEMENTGLFERIARVYETGESFVESEIQLPIGRGPNGEIEQTFWNFVLQPSVATGSGFDGSGPERDVVVHAVDVTPQVLSRRELEAARAALESRVEARTAQLTQANAVLALEIEGRVQDAEDRNILLQRLAGAQEAERRHLSRELHDEVGQHLTALGLRLQELAQVTEPGSVAERHVSELQSMTSLLGRELHTIALQLRPRALDDFGLDAALAAYARSWSKQSGIVCQVHAETEAARLPTAIESAVYRVVQEALTNVAKHSGATRASVVVERRDGQVNAIVEDDGRGFESASPAERSSGLDAAGGLGILGIQERAAQLGGSVDVESAPGRGTTLFFRIPERARGMESRRG
jgi:signal transduction histidine kinase